MARGAELEQRTADDDGEHRGERLAKRHLRKAAQAKPHQECGKHAGDMFNSDLAIKVGLHGLALTLYIRSYG